MEKKTTIRTEVLNMTLADWKKIDSITINGTYIEVSPMDLLRLIQFDGGQFLSSKLNDSERLFVDEYYKLGRELATLTALDELKKSE